MSRGVIPNRLESIRKLAHGLGPVQHLGACYEAGPDRTAATAEKLARCHRAGELTAIWVPTAEQEAWRDLVRAREAAKRDQRKARHRLGKFFLRHGRQRPDGVKAWTKKHREWIQSDRSQHCLRGWLSVAIPDGTAADGL